MAESSSKAPLPEGTKVVTEGKGSILQRGNDVFYNKAQVANRDISLAVLRWFMKVRAEENAERKRKPRPKQLPPAPLLAERVEGIRILEGLAATGLRAIRYAMELEGVGQVVANDMDPKVVESMKRNIEYNGGQASSKIKTTCSDARIIMMQNLEAFDAVDLDPYGSPATLLDSALQALNDGGLLMVTATDMAILAGNHAETCYTKYGCYSLHRGYLHEQALRILLACTQTHAARHKKYIVPVVSLSIDFYVRLFMRVYNSPATAKESASKLAYVWQSSGCDAFWLQPVGRKSTKADGSVKFQASQGPAVPQECPISEGKFTMGGPIWSGRIHDPAAVTAILEQIESSRRLYPSHAKLVGLLTAVSEELPDVPLYYTLHDLCKSLRVAAPKSEVFRNALVNAGFVASMTHCQANGIKTNAPPEAVYDILRCWVKKNPVKIVDPTSYQAKILAKEPKLVANFARAPGVLSNARAAGKARFVPNPENWGPRPRHGRPPLKHEQEQEDAAKAEDTSKVKAEGTTDGKRTNEETKDHADSQGDAKRAKVEDKAEDA